MISHFNFHICLNYIHEKGYVLHVSSLRIFIKFVFYISDFLHCVHKKLGVVFCLQYVLSIITFVCVWYYFSQLMDIIYCCLCAKTQKQVWDKLDKVNSHVVLVENEKSQNKKMFSLGVRKSYFTLEILIHVSFM